MINNIRKSQPIIVIAADDSRSKAKAAADYICSGSSDEVIINQATTSGGTVFLAQGTYNCKDQILVPSNTTLECATGVLFKVESGHTLANNYTMYGTGVSALITNSDHVNGNSNIKIIGANIDFESGIGVAIATKYSEQTWSGIWLHKCTRSHIQDCVVDNVCYEVNWATGRSFGVLVSQSQDIRVWRCEANECGYEGIGIRGGNRNILVQDCGGYRNRQHIAQVSAFAPGTPSYGGYGSEGVVFDRMYGEGNICFHNSTKTDAVTAVTAYSEGVSVNSFTVAGDVTAYYGAGYLLYQYGGYRDINQGLWRVVSSTYNSGDDITVIVVEYQGVNGKNIDTNELMGYISVPHVGDTLSNSRDKVTFSMLEGPFINPQVINNNLQGMYDKTPISVTLNTALIKNLFIYGNNIDGTEFNTVTVISIKNGNPCTGSIENLVIRNNNIISGSTKYPINIEFDGNFDGTVDNIVIQNNTLVGDFCIRLVMNSGEGKDGLKNLTVIGNVLDARAYSGTCLSGSMNFTGKLLFLNNVCKADWYGLRYFDNLSCIGYVSGNDFTGVGVTIDKDNAADLTWANNIGIDIPTAE